MAKFGTFSNLDFKYGNVNVASIFKGANKIFGYPLATGGTETYIEQDGKYYKVHTFTDTDPTSLLLNFDGSNGSTTFTDESGWGHSITANGNSAISTTQSKFGGSSAYFDGNGDYLSVNHPSFAIGTSPVTVEMWVRFSSLPSSGSSFGFCGTQTSISTADNTAWYFSLTNSGGIYGLRFARHGDANVEAGATWSPSIDTWYHIAAVKQSSGVILLFADGVSLSVSQSSEAGWQSNNFSQTNFAVGGIATPVYMHGYIDSLRITKGQALYTSNFTPSTTALTRVGSGSLVVSQGGEVEYLVVGGGGGGGYDVGGGGGAGGLLTGSLVAASGSKSVSVGGGGAPGIVASRQGYDGGDSSFSIHTALGGGGGGGYITGSGRNGGSGGGGGSDSPSAVVAGSGDAGPPRQGYDGGTGAIDGFSGNFGSGGGGGGAGGAGQSAASGADGGVGVQSDISGAATYYAGGGGGSDDSGSGGEGGLGGGGDADGVNGTANTGGGGGGAGASTGGSGGSGIVIVRYPISKSTFILNS